jgi:hypothetical protein
MSEHFTDREKKLGLTGNLDTDLQIIANFSDGFLNEYIKADNKYITSLLVNDDYFLYKLSKRYPNSVKYVLPNMCYRQFYYMITNSLEDMSLPFIKKYYPVIKWMIDVDITTAQKCADLMAAYGTVDGLEWVKSLSPNVVPNYPSKQGAIMGFLRGDEKITQWLYDTKWYNVSVASSDNGPTNFSNSILKKRPASPCWGTYE